MDFNKADFSAKEHWRTGVELRRGYRSIRNMSEFWQSKKGMRKILGFVRNDHVYGQHQKYIYK